MEKEVIIEARDLTVSFTVQRHGINSIKDFIISLGLKTPFEKKTVLNNLHMKIWKGECVGIMGRNGCGKSTLLRTIAGIMTPDSGYIAVNGSVAPLMSLGAGLEPELTGRENIELVAALNGLTRKQIQQSMSSIIAFSELSVDEIEMQVKRYSSGMISRLSFSIAVANTPEILIIDEALAVGDVGFRRKCGERINEIKNSGATIIYVSHHIEEVKSICSRVLVLEGGRFIFEGNVDDANKLYESIV